VFASLALAACSTSQPSTVPGSAARAAFPAPVLFGQDGTIDTVAGGVLHRSYVIPSGPWVVHVLDVDRAACPGLVAVKGAAGAIGRTTTSALVTGHARVDRAVAGGVNADFFLFDPPGVPQGALVAGGRVITGPGLRPVLAVDSAGRTWMGTLTVSGWAVAASDSIPIDTWNRSSPRGLAWFDRGYGAQVDTASGSVRVVVSARGDVLAIDTAAAATAIPSSGGVLVVRRGAPVTLRERLAVLARGRGHFDVRVGLRPFHPREVVGGFPILVEDSAEVAGLDSAGAATFGPVRHPRTFVAVGANGRRLLLATVDGRQEGYSAGTTLRETAQLALQLGATQAINLDGGGSTAMVVARQAGGRAGFEVVNRPSDAAGERPVGDALVVTCRRP